MKSLKRASMSLPSCQKVSYWQQKVSKKTPTIILVHGFRGTHHGLQGIVAELPEYNCIVPDLPGFGESAPLRSNTDESIDSMIQFLDEFIKQLGLDHPPVLLGHSFGSILASAYAARHQKSIERLILVNPIGNNTATGLKRIIVNFTGIFYGASRYLPAKLARSWLAMSPVTEFMNVVLIKSPDKQVRKYIRQEHRNYFSSFNDTTTVVSTFQMSTRCSALDEAENISVPTLLIIGALDVITDVESQKSIAKLIPNSKIHVIDKSGHLVHYETPKEVASAIRRFLTR